MKNMVPSEIYIFGYFGYVTDKLDGQTVKTRMVKRLFEEKLGGEVPYFDTEIIKSNKFSLLWALFQIIKAKYVIYLPAQNSLKQFFNPLYFLSQLFRFKIYYFVIGGWLPQFISTNKNIKKKLRKISRIYVETKTLEKLLKNENFINIDWFPNFRFRERVTFNKIESEKLRIVFLSRVTKKKGIDLIFWFLKSIAESKFIEKVQIDFYGPVDEHDKDYFYGQLKSNKSVNYRGIVEPGSVQKLLAGYDLLVLPTRYEGEGCPGIIIDAYFAGLPVLSTNWKYNSEFVINGETGYLFDPADKTKFRDILLSLIVNKSCLKEMRYNAMAFSKKFDSENAWGIIKSNF